MVFPLLPLLLFSTHLRSAKLSFFYVNHFPRAGCGLDQVGLGGDDASNTELMTSAMQKWWRHHHIIDDVIIAEWMTPTPNSGRRYRWIGDVGFFKLVTSAYPNWWHHHPHVRDLSRSLEGGIRWYFLTEVFIFGGGGFRGVYCLLGVYFLKFFFGVLRDHTFGQFYGRAGECFRNKNF